MHSLLVCVLLTNCWAFPASESAGAKVPDVRDGHAYSNRSTEIHHNTPGTLVVIGGYTKGQGHNTVLQFDVFAGQVVETVNGPDMPHDLWFASIAQQGNDIYVTGGRSNDLASSAPYQAMRLQYGLWQQVPYLSETRLEPTSFVLGNTLYVASGTDSILIEQLDLDKIAAGWTPAPFGLPFRMNAVASTVIGDSVYLTTAHYLLTLSLSAPGWVALYDMSIPRTGHCMVTDGVSRLFVLGGVGTLSVDMFDIPAYQWTVKAPIPHYQSMLTGHGCVYHDGFIYVVGGMGVNFYSGNIYVYDVYNDSWKTHSNVMLPNTELSLGLLTWG